MSSQESDEFGVSLLLTSEKHAPIDEDCGDRTNFAFSSAQALVQYLTIRVQSHCEREKWRRKSFRRIRGSSYVLRK